MVDANADIYREVLKLLYVFSFSLGLWTCLNMLVNKLGPKDVRFSLMAFITVLLIIPTNGYLGMILDEPMSVLDSIARTLTWCYGPLMLLLVNRVLQNRHSPIYTILHFCPFAFASSMHFAHLDWWGFHFYLPVLLLQVGVYLAWSLLLLYRQRARVLVLRKEFKNSSFYWMLYLVAGLFVIVLYDSALMLSLHLGAELNL